jgi:hypothetical protein
LAEVQAEVGQKIMRVYGNASDGVLSTITKRKGNVNRPVYEKNLARQLGGAWKVEVIQKPNTRGKFYGEPEPKYTIEATRTGE